MKQTITRTITSTTINYITIDMVGGEPKIENQEPLKVNGNIGKDEALKEVQKHHENDEITYNDELTYKVTSLEYNTNKYEMTVNDFIEKATIIKEEK